MWFAYRRRSAILSSRQVDGTMAAILQVRFASLDCAHLGALARDFYSDEVGRRECSRRFLKALRDAG